MNESEQCARTSDSISQAQVRHLIDEHHLTAPLAFQIVAELQEIREHAFAPFDQIHGTGPPREKTGLAAHLSVDTTASQITVGDEVMHITAVGPTGRLYLSEVIEPGPNRAERRHPPKDEPKTWPPR